jgi:hypothetical protein
MSDISESDWSFEEIRASNPTRAESLEFAASPEDLVSVMSSALEEACNSKKVRLAIDSKENKFVHKRAIIQFHLSPDRYDWFFNARSGYRAQFWIAPEIGMRFNEKIIIGLTDVLVRHLPQTVEVRRIKVINECGSRKEADEGAEWMRRDEFLRSLSPVLSKIWICERLYDPSGGGLLDIGFSTLSAAERSPKLSVQRWNHAKHPCTGQVGEGLRAPLPSDEDSWVDVKGGFLAQDGGLDQIKSTNKRAEDIHVRGWT